MTQPAPSRNGGRRILVIEDHRDAADSMKLLLELLGHSVTLAHTGPDGVAAASGGKFDIVFCDIGLPGGLDGYGVARALREGGGSAALVALSGYGQCEDRERARLAGFDLHLTKPVELDDLQRALGTTPA